MIKFNYFLENKIIYAQSNNITEFNYKKKGKYISFVQIFFPFKKKKKI